MKYIFVVLLVLFTASTCFSEDYDEFDRDLREFGMFYKAAEKNIDTGVLMPQAEVAVGKAIASWSDLKDRYTRNPPLAFIGFKDFGRRMDLVADLLEESLFDVIDGQIDSAKSKMGFVRVILWELRARAGVLSLADKLTDVYTLKKNLERKLEGNFDLKDRDVMSLAAILSIKWEEVASLPAGEADMREYHNLVRVGRDNLRSLASALSSEDMSEVKAAIGGFSKCLARMYSLPSVM